MMSYIFPCLNSQHILVNANKTSRRTLNLSLSLLFRVKRNNRSKIRESSKNREKKENKKDINNNLFIVTQILYHINSRPVFLAVISLGREVHQIRGFPFPTHLSIQ